MQYEKNSLPPDNKPVGIEPPSIPSHPLTIPAVNQQVDPTSTLNVQVNSIPVKESIRIWMAMILLPVLAFTLTTLLSLIFHILFPGPHSSSDPVVVISTVIGTILIIGSVLGFVLIPVWLVMLIMTIRRNRRMSAFSPLTQSSNGAHIGKSRATAFILAVCFGLFEWFDTYKFKDDKKKFWINFGLLIVTLGG